MQIETELIVDDNNKIKALLNDVNDDIKWRGLVKIVKGEIKNYLRQYININKFSYELKDTVRQQLFDHLNLQLQGYGRQVGYLNLSSDANASAKQLVPVKCNVECEVQRYSDPIFVENTILMLPLSTAIYKSNEAYKLEAWVESKLEEIIKPLLLEKKYIDVLLNFENVAETIRNEMEKKAKAIGYELKQIVSVPNLEHLELKEDFDLEVTAKEFLTNDANVQISLGISATAKIVDFTKIQDYLKPRANIKSLIEGAISRTTSQFLSNISPERYYIRFYHPGENEKGEQEKQSVQDELIQAIKLELEKRFSAVVSRVNTNVYDTEIAKHFKKLYGQIGSFEVELPSLTGIEESVVYKGDFQIEGVDKNSWHKFQARRPEMEQISASIIRRLNARLTTFSKDDLQYTELDYLSLIEGLINTWALENVIDQFGVTIRITNLYRERTEQETLLSAETKFKLQQYQQTRLKQIEAQAQIAIETHRFELEELRQLRAERLNIVAKEDNEDILEELDDKIRAIEKKALTSSLEDAASKVIKSPASKARSLRELAEQEQAKLQGSQNNNPVLDSAGNNNTPQIKEGEDSE